MKASPSLSRHLDELSPASDRIWLIGMTTGLSLTMVAAFAPLPAGGGTMCAYLGLLVRSALYLCAGEALPIRGGVIITRLFRMGIVAGLFELIVDWWLVNGVANGRLDYLGARDVVLLASPIWMPVAWACVIVELGYPALRLFAATRLRARLPAARVRARALIEHYGNPRRQPLRGGATVTSPTPLSRSARATKPDAFASSMKSAR